VHTVRRFAPHALGEHLARVLRVYAFPALGSDHPPCRAGYRQKCQRENYYKPVRRRLPLRHVGRIDDIDGRDFFGFLDSRQLVLPVEQLVDGLLRR
jgi:hypothetical protein